MTIQEKLNQLRTYLSKEDMPVSSLEEKENLETVLEEATKIFEMGDISRMDPELLEEVYAKWDNILDSKLSLFPEFNQEVKHHM